MFSIDWNEIKIVVAVAQHGSLRAAAAATGMDVASVSRGLASLEARVGVPLFERTRSGSTPTAFGLTLVRASQSMLDGATAFADVLRTHTVSRQDTAREVMLYASAGLVSLLLMPAFTGALMPEHPMYETAMSFNLDTLPSVSFTSENPSKADIALLWASASSTPSLPWSKGTEREIGTIPFRLVASEAYLRRFGQPHSLDELATEWHRVVTIEYFRHVPFYERWEDVTSVVPSKRRLSAKDMMDGISLVQGGGGIALLPEFSVRQVPGLVALDVQSPVPAPHLWLATHAGKSPETDAVALLVERLFTESGGLLRA